MDGHERERVKRLYGALSDDDVNAVNALCDAAIRFEPGTSTLGLERSEYSGHSGIREFLAEIRVVWDEVSFTPCEVRADDAALLVRGRIFARGADLGIRDIPILWRWESEAGLFTRCRAGAPRETHPRQVAPPRA